MIKSLDENLNYKKTIKNSFFIVGIGTSAGGLEALKIFFAHLPEDFNHAIVIVQHLSPDFKSLMADLLSRNTKLPIHEVTNNTIIEAGNVYLIPPKKI
ncbi:chemotaxis protein CheB [Polaribacter ponticola]|uniref:protein-glutamate methylesterase n=1 Tax=Polaribacter ponticola TaxID=2978475 RepID=A0ABT5SCC6_9FLAO|nr:chemotaxis protein CheB [Polaribacter sp. MSW5]MDD7915738.1 chemotaxis protein CheB [Polaribacter sp. MSW5]